LTSDPQAAKRHKLTQRGPGRAPAPRAVHMTNRAISGTFNLACLLLSALAWASIVTSGSVRSWVLSPSRAPAATRRPLRTRAQRAGQRTDSATENRETE